MMPSLDPNDFHGALLNARLARVEETLYGDGKENKGVVHTVQKISDTLIGQRWRDYALVLIIVLVLIELMLIVLLSIRVY